MGHINMMVSISMLFVLTAVVIPMVYSGIFYTIFVFASEINLATILKLRSAIDKVSASQGGAIAHVCLLFLSVSISLVVISR
jgi:hypothetical protein